MIKVKPGKNLHKNSIKGFTRCNLIRPWRSNPEQLGQVWTHHSNLTQLGILITIRYLTQDKKVTITKVFTFWLLYLNGSSQNLTFLWDIAPCGTISKWSIPFYLSYHPEIRKNTCFWSLCGPLFLLSSSHTPKINPSRPFLRYEMRI